MAEQKSRRSVMQCSVLIEDKEAFSLKHHSKKPVPRAGFSSLQDKLTERQKDIVSLRLRQAGRQAGKRAVIGAETLSICLSCIEQEGNGPIDLRRQGQ